MRVPHNLAIGLLVFVLVRESLSILADPQTRYNSNVYQRRDAPQDTETLLQGNGQFVKKLMSKRFVRNEKARKHSNVAVGNGVIAELNKSSQQLPTNKLQEVVKDVTEKLKGPQLPQMVDNNGMLGISGEEDSAKWAASQIKMIPAKLKSKEKESEAVQSNNSIKTGLAFKNDPRIRSPPKIAQITQSTETSKTVAASNSNGANDADFKALKPSNDIKIPKANTTKAMINPRVGDNVVMKPYFSQGIRTKTGDSTNSSVRVDQTNSNAIPHNNVTVGLEKTTKETTSVNPAGLLLQSNRTSNELLPSKSTAATNKEEEDKAPSLSINVTALRKGQSFDLQMPALKTAKGTFDDKHLYLAPQMTLSSEYVSDSSQNSSSDFLNDALNTVNDEEQKNEKVLQKLNSDIVSRKGDPLTTKVSPGDGFFDEAFREEAPAGRTFADKQLEEPEQQAQQMQQDETLERALNQSSVSSIIFSANEAISSSDSNLQAFSKKSAQGSDDAGHKGLKYKRSKFIQSLPDHHGKHKKVDHKATARQVINFGNHLLWVGGQGAADANGFPRHETGAEDAQYNVNSYISSFLDSSDEKGRASTTKGYKALQNALSSMETNQGEEDPSFQFGISGNKELQDTNQGSAPTKVLIQDDAGKPVYQGIVNIVKLNNSKSSDNATTQVKAQNQEASISSEDEASNKSSEHFQAKQESLRETDSNDQSSISGSNITASLPTDGDEKVNQTKSLDNTGNGDENNFNASKGTSANQMPTKEVKEISQGEQMQYEYQDQQQPSSGAQPSAIIKQLKTNSNEPETYHIVVNDVRKKITNANGHVTVIISGPTANQASMSSENTLLIPQTTSPGSLSEKSVSSNENRTETLGDGQGSLIQTDQLLNSLANGTQDITSQTLPTANNTSPNSTNGSLSLLQEGAVSALKISEGIEGQLNNDQPEVERENQDQKASTSEVKQTRPVNSPSTESHMQEGHHFVKIDQDLNGGVDGFQIDEVSRPNIQEEQREEKENPYLEGLEKSLAEHSQDVPTLNIILDPSQKFGSTLSVGGKVVPLTSGKSGGDSMQVGNKQQLDCHSDLKNRKTTVTILTCQKKQGLPQIPMSLSGQNGAYFNGGQMSGGPSLQLDQVMNVLNDQVKATINNEMKSESKDIQKMLTGMTAPSSTLMDADEASSQMESPQRSSLVGPDEYTSLPEDEERGRWGRRHSHHRRTHHFGFPFTSRLPNYLGFLNHAFPPHRRHFWGVHRHPNPFVVMAHKDHSGEGYWDYQHNIFIPHEEGDDDDDDEDEEEKRERQWNPWSQQPHRKGNWFMPHPRFHQHHFSPFTHHDLFHLRMPTLFGRSGPWKPKIHKQEQGSKRTAVMHKTVRGDRDTCRPIIEGPSPPLKGEWEYLGKVLCSCPCRLSDAEW